MFSSNTFDADRDIPDLTGKVVIVTGGNNGLGAASVKQLAKHNAHVFMGARTASKAEATIAEIKEEHPQARITFLGLDLASFESIKKAAESFQASSTKLDVLMNNAGVMALPASMTKDGYEIQFGTNHLGHALFTKLLMPVLQRTADEGSDVRIVNLTSAGHALPPKGGLVLKEVNTDMGAFSTWVRYGQSKLANILFTRELARRYPSIKSSAVHPGGIDTGLSLGFQRSHPWLAALLRPIALRVLKTPQQGCLTQLYAATSADVKNGQYYVPTAVENTGSKYSQDQKLAEELWQWTESELAKHGY